MSKLRERQHNRISRSMDEVITIDNPDKPGTRLYLRISWIKAISKAIPMTDNGRGLITLDNGKRYEFDLMEARHWPCWLSRRYNIHFYTDMPISAKVVGAKIK